MGHDEYLRELRLRLRFRGAPRRQVEDILAELDSHLTESGEDPVEAFGPPDEYAASLLRSRWHSVRFILAVTLATTAGVITAHSAPAFTDGLAAAFNAEHAPIELTTQRLLHLLPPVLLAAVMVLPVAHARLSRGQRVLAGIGIGTFGGVLVTQLGDWGFGHAPLLTLSPPAALATVLGLLAATTLLMLAPQWRHRLPLSPSA